MLSAADMPGAEDGLSASQRRAREVARKYKESEELDQRRKQRSGKVWTAVAVVNTVRPCLTECPMRCDR